MILLSVFSFLMVQTFSKSTLKEVNANTENLTYQSYNTADILLSSTYNNFYNLYNADTKISNALYASEFNNLEIKDICDLLQAQAKSSPIVKSIYIYNRKAKMVFTSLPSISSTDDFMDADAIKIIDNFMSYKKTIIPRKATYEFIGSTYNYNFISLIFYDYTSNFVIDSAMIINIDQDVFQKMVASSKNRDNNQLFIIDNSGVVISHTDPKMINSKLTNEPYISKILSAKDKQGYFTSKVNGDTSLINYIKSDRLGWTFIGIGEYKTLLSNFQRVKNYVLLVTLLFVFVGILVAAFFTTNIYKPLYKLLTEIRSKSEAGSKGTAMNEYDYLKTTFNNLVDNNMKLKSNIYEYSFAKKNEILLQILNGDFSNPINAEVLKKSDIWLNSNYYCAVIIKLDAFIRLCTSYTANDLTLFKFAILNIVNETLGREFKLEGVDSGNDHVSIIVNLKNDSPSSIDTLKLLLGEAHVNIEKYLKITVTSAIGNVVYDYKSIHDSYINALYAAGYRMITGENSVILYLDFAQRRVMLRDYPYNIEKQLIAALKQRNEKKAEENLKDFFEHIKPYNYDEIFMSISQLMMIIVRSFSNHENFDFESTGITFASLYEGLKNFDTLIEMQQYINSFLIQIANCKHRSNNNKKQEIVDNIIEYLETNFSEPNISVEMIADRVELSVNYVRAIFKEATDKSISDYLLELRIKKAKELLLSTEYTAKEISQMVGYPAARYFYVVFKKITGMTADSYRKSFSEKG